MGISPHDEHECSPYCRGNRHADVFWTIGKDEHMERYARAFLADYGLRLVHWEQAPEALWPEGELAIRYHDDGTQELAPPDPDERPFLLVWTAAT